MKPARSSQRRFEETRLMIIDENVQHRKFADLKDFLHPGDLIVYNNAATVPSSFRVSAELEIRLASFVGPDPKNPLYWHAALFGAGNWKLPTEDRGPVPHFPIGHQFVISDELTFTLEAFPFGIENGNHRVVRLKVRSENPIRSLFIHGKPIQYSYLNEELNVWDQQSIFSTVPISVEPASASFPFSWNHYVSLSKMGIHFTPVTHSAGISTLGDSHVDQHLPLPEWFDIPPATVKLVSEARKRGSKIYALGTTPVRALESAVDDEGFLHAGSSVASTVLDKTYKRRIVDGLITGMHDVGTSHNKLMESFCDRSRIRLGISEARGYYDHEYGDISLLKCFDE